MGWTKLAGIGPPQCLYERGDLLRIRVIAIHHGLRLIAMPTATTAHGLASHGTFHRARPWRRLSRLRSKAIAGRYGAAARRGVIASPAIRRAACRRLRRC